MDNDVLVALIVGGLALFGTLGLGYFNNKAAIRARSAEAKQRKIDRQEDYSRQDEVALRAQHAADLLLEKQDEATKAADLVADQAASAVVLLLAKQDEVAAATVEARNLLAKNIALVAEKAEQTSAQLTEIHILVNSNMTSALQSELDAMRRELVMMRKVVVLNDSAGHPSTADDEAAIAYTVAKIAELTLVLQDRQEAAEKVERLKAAVPPEIDKKL